MEYMHSFAKSVLLSSKEYTFFEDEREVLLDYIEEQWDVRMLQCDIVNIKSEELSLDELWKKALSICAFHFALQVWGEDMITQVPFLSTIDRDLYVV